MHIGKVSSTKGTWSWSVSRPTHQAAVVVESEMKIGQFQGKVRLLRILISRHTLLYRAGAHPKGGCRFATPQIRNQKKGKPYFVEMIKPDVIRDFLLRRNQRFKFAVD